MLNVAKFQHNQNLVKKVTSFKLQSAQMFNEKALRPKVMKIRDKETVKDTPARQRGAIAQRPSQLFAQRCSDKLSNQYNSAQQSNGIIFIQNDKSGNVNV